MIYFPNLTCMFEDLYPSNPFYEKWGRGRPSLSKLVTKDFYNLWIEDDKLINPQNYRSPFMFMEFLKNIKPIEKVNKPNGSRTVLVRYNKITTA